MQNCDGAVDCMKSCCLLPFLCNLLYICQLQHPLKCCLDKSTLGSMPRFSKPSQQSVWTQPTTFTLAITSLLGCQFVHIASTVLAMSFFTICTRACLYRMRQKYFYYESTVCHFVPHVLHISWPTESNQAICFLLTSS